MTGAWSHSGLLCSLIGGGGRFLKDLETHRPIGDRSKALLVVFKEAVVVFLKGLKASQVLSRWPLWAPAWGQMAPTADHPPPPTLDFIRDFHSDAD
jgi:hypothetical protein